MEKDRYYFRVGLFIVLSMIAAVWTLSLFARDSMEQAGTVTYAIYFEGGVNGLSVGSPVKLKGIEVGRVRNISFTKNQSDLIRVLVKISETAPIRDDTFASLQLQGITGTSIVSLENKPEMDPAKLVKQTDDKYPVIRSQKSSLEQIVSTLPELMGKLNSISAQANKLLSDENIAHVSATLSATESSMQHLSAALEEVPPTLKEIRLTAEQARMLLGSGNQASLSATLDHLNNASKELENLLDGINQDKISDILQETERVLLEGKTALRELKMLGRTVREEPSILLRGVDHEGATLP